MSPQQEDEVGQGDVDEDVLEVEQRRKQRGAGVQVVLRVRFPSSVSASVNARELEGRRTHLSCGDQAPHQDAEEEAVVLKVDVVYDEEAGVEQDRRGDDARSRVVGRRGRACPAAVRRSRVSDVRCLSARRDCALRHAPEEAQDEDKFGEDDGRALERDRRRGRIAEVVESDYFGVDDVGKGRQDALEEGKEGRIVNGPLGGGLPGRESRQRLAG